MMAGFLNLDDDPSEVPTIGSGLKNKPPRARHDVDAAAAERVGEAHGFTRTTSPRAPVVHAQAPRRGRPPLNETMTYWRIYIAPDLRDELNALRDLEGRRLNDLLRDMLEAYKAAGQAAVNPADSS